MRAFREQPIGLIDLNCLNWLAVTTVRYWLSTEQSAVIISDFMRSEILISVRRPTEFEVLFSVSSYKFRDITSDLAVIFYTPSFFCKCLYTVCLVTQHYTSYWPVRGRSRAEILGSNPAGACVSVSCERCELSGRGFCDVLIILPGESYRLWCVIVRVLETSWMRRPWLS